MLGVLFSLFALGLVVVLLALVLASDTSHTVVHLRQVAGRDVNSVVSQFRQLIGENTK